MKTTLLTTTLILTLHSALLAQTFNWEARTRGDQEFAIRSWIPEESIRAVITLTPGLDGDGRGMADDPSWQEFARQHGCALVALSARGGGYYIPSKWSGRMLQDGLDFVAKESKRPEVATTPLLMWGHSAGGQFNYNFAAWKPQRVMGFIINKGAYYDERATPGVRKVPALCIAGEKDTELRVTNITKLYEDNRRLGALWGLLIEPGEGHGQGRSREIARVFFADVLAGAKEPWLGDLQTNEIQPDKPGVANAKKLTWFPGEATAKLWQEIRAVTPTPVP